MKKIVSVSNMRKSDAYTIEHYMSGKTLMYRAGLGIYENVKWYGRIAVVCGSGNNAGDGYVLAYILHENGYKPDIFLIKDKFSENGKYYFDMCMQDGINAKLCDENIDFSEYEIIADCIFGTGFCGEASGMAGLVIDKINESNAYVVSADINSGMNGDSGMGERIVKSDKTISIGDLKPGHFLGKAKDYINEVKNCDIGIEIVDEPYYLLENDDVRKHIGVRDNFSHKSTYGIIALIGGSMKYSGAIRLADTACTAMRSGAGVVKLACPKSISGHIIPAILESTLFPLSDDDGSIIFVKEEIDELMKGTDVIAAGMGIGNSEETEKLISYLLDNYKGIFIIDADGLNALAHIDKNKIRNTDARVILTPHMKEFERLSGISIADTSKDPIDNAKKYAAENKCTVLLKGPSTIITDGAAVYITDKGCPGMATAGSGDVLSGIMAAVCGYGGENVTLSAAAAAYINGFAGELAQKENGAVSMVAGDTAGHVADAVKIITVS